MSHITLSLPGDPLACPRPRAVVRGKRAASYMPTEYTEAKTSLAAAIVAALDGSRPAWLLCGARLSLVAVFPRPATRPATVDKLAWKSGARVRRLSRPDADNLWKAYADALTVALGCVGLPWDDALLEIGATDRYYAAVGEAAGVVLRLCPLVDNPVDNSGGAR